MADFDNETDDQDLLQWLSEIEGTVDDHHAVSQLQPCDAEEYESQSIHLTNIEKQHNLAPSIPFHGEEYDSDDVPLARFVTSDLPARRYDDESEYDSDDFPLASYVSLIAKRNASITNDEQPCVKVDTFNIRPIYTTLMSTSEGNTNNIPSGEIQWPLIENDSGESSQGQEQQISSEPILHVSNIITSAEIQTGEVAFSATEAEVQPQEQLMAVELTVQQNTTHINLAEVEPVEEDPIEHRGRKRRRPESTYLRNERRRKRNRGEEYMSSKGKAMRSREMKQGCGGGCKLKCHEKLPQNAREEIFHGFWRLGDSQRQWDFLCAHVSEIDAKRTANLKEKICRRTRTKIWTMPHSQDGNVRVCKTFFLDTLCISETRVQTAINKMSAVRLTQTDLRGKHGKRKETQEEERKAIKLHIESFPTIESHYCRHNTQRRYLEADLSLQKMHALYKERNSNAACLTTYKNIFYNDYNMGFHRPKKDICDFCSVYLHSDAEIRENDKAKYEDHRRNVELIRKYKASIKEEVKTNKEKAGATFDLEEVLVTPKSNESCLYYKRKLNNYNLTVFDFDSTLGRNYIWNECQAKRGSVEIASCVFKYLKDKAAEGKRKIHLFSDSCSGQNRNKNFLGMLWHVVRSTTIDEIEHSFFIRGHSENESDSVHSCISRASKNISIYTTPQWAATIRNAKRHSPKYLVHEMSQEDFLDFNAISQEFKNLNVDTNGEKINWLNIKRYIVKKSDPQHFVVHLEYDGPEHTINFTQGLRRRHPELTLETRSLDKAYSKLLPLNRLKFEDLKSLCEAKIIPPVHHPFYENLE